MLATVKAIINNKNAVSSVYPNKPYNIYGIKSNGHIT
jgi:hypothetical protein